MNKYVCSICGFIYDEAKGIPDAGIAPGTKWEDLPEDWTCPLCGAPKPVFEKQMEAAESSGKTKAKAVMQEQEEEHSNPRELTQAELSAICSNLAKGCEKQYLAEESELFSKLANYYLEKANSQPLDGEKSLLEEVNFDLQENYKEANEEAASASDRGAKRALTWSEKVTRIQKTLIEKYQKEGTSFFENTKIWICEICGFIYIGDAAPEVCPICKVPKLKIEEVK